jgi:outer membrane protein W
MKHVFKTGIISMMLSSCLFAANPRPGWYGGIFLGGTYSTKDDYIFIHPWNKNTYLGEMEFSGMGNIGAQVGYKWFPLRLELEFDYNYTPYQTLTSGAYTYRSPKTSTGLRLKGNTSTAALFFNSYYDFYSAGSNSDWSPYIGVGVGYANLWSGLKWYYNEVERPGTHIKNTVSTPATQGIIGVSYFLDDYTAFSLDYRYMTTAPISLFNDQRFVINAINIGFNGSFNCG